MVPLPLSKVSKWHHLIRNAVVLGLLKVSWCTSLFLEWVPLYLYPSVGVWICIAMDTANAVWIGMSGCLLPSVRDHVRRRSNSECLDVWMECMIVLMPLIIIKPFSSCVGMFYFICRNLGCRDFLFLWTLANLLCLAGDFLPHYQWW